MILRAYFRLPVPSLTIFTHGSLKPLPSMWKVVFTDAMIWGQLDTVLLRLLKSTPFRLVALDSMMTEQVLGDGLKSRLREYMPTLDQKGLLRI